MKKLLSIVPFLLGLLSGCTIRLDTSSSVSSDSLSSEASFSSVSSSSDSSSSSSVSGVDFGDENNVNGDHSSSGTVLKSECKKGVVSDLYVPSESDRLEIIVFESHQYYGDSILIDYGNFEILIDAGNTHNSDKNTIGNYLKKYVTDRCLDMLIVTHPHGDHFGGFNSPAFNVLTVGGIDSVNYIVDFGTKQISGQTTSNYNSYVTVRKNLIDQGSTYYSIYECFNGSHKNNDYANLFQITDHFSLQLLNTGHYGPYDQYYTESDEINNASVALLIQYGNYKYLLCGDGQSDVQNGLMSRYPNLFTDDDFVIVKANHHGSNGESGNVNGARWINWVKPDKMFVSSAIIDVNRVFPEGEKNTYGLTGYGQNGIGVYKKYGTTSGGSENTGSKNANQHPHGGAMAHYAEVLGKNDVYWNGTMGTIHITHDSPTSNPEFRGDGRTYDYYYPEGYNYATYGYGNHLLKADRVKEKNLPYYQTAWALTNYYSSNKEYKIPLN